MTKEQGKKAIHGIKDDLGLANDFHGKITEFGYYLDKDGNYLGYLYDYLE